jgi:small subunit ribosomal protein S14
MSQFRAKKLDLGGFINARVIRDHTKRKVFAAHEQERYETTQHLLAGREDLRGYANKCFRQALRYMARNMSLPERVRANAQLSLHNMHCYSRSTQIKNRCVMGGIARGVFRDFRMGRVCLVRSG